MAEEVKKKILIIDDDKFLLDMYSMKFDEKGFDVVSCSGAEEALEKLEGGLQRDIILVDVVMQKMDGFTFVDTIVKNNLRGNSTVIILSNLGQKEDVERGVALGANGYIVKASATPSEVVSDVISIDNNTHNPS